MNAGREAWFQKCFGLEHRKQVRKADVRWLDNNADFPCGIISSALSQKKKCLTFYKLDNIFFFKLNHSTASSVSEKHVILIMTKCCALQ